MILKNTEDIIQWLKKMHIDNYVIHDDLTVDVNENVNLEDKKLTHIPIQFGIVKGYFNCSHNRLKSLKGAPYNLEGSFYCSNNKLTSLEYSPQKVDEYFCYFNELSTLQGCSEIINGDFDCSYNKLISLEGCPEVIHGHVNCSYNELASLLYCAKTIHGNFACESNKLTSLKHIPQFVFGNFYCQFNDIFIFDFENIEIEGIFDCKHTIKQRLIKLDEYYNANNVLHIPFKLLKNYFFELKLENDLTYKSSYIKQPKL